MDTPVELLAQSINALLDLLRDPAWDGVAALVALVLALQHLLRRLLALLAKRLREISLSEASEHLSEVLDSVTLPYEHAELVPQSDHSAELGELREALLNRTLAVDFYASVRNTLRNSVIDLLKVPIPRVQYVPHRVRYRPMRTQVRHGFPHIVGPSFYFVPGGIRIGTDYRTPPYLNLP
jgi:hypothetical protein